MDPIKLGSGDNNSTQRMAPTFDDAERKDVPDDGKDSFEECILPLDKKFSSETITIQTIDDHENRLKDRISQCRNIIEALKVELTEEKAKIEKETKNQQLDYQAQPELLPYKTQTTGPIVSFTSRNKDDPSLYDFLGDYPLNSSVYSACVDTKLSCDESLMEYEKQLEQYQTTLNMAQMEKKNAIRKQMLTKAYRLKLLEIENQCNIELLRVKQSLQCLEPLKMVASKWKTNSDDSIDLDSYELMPPYPEISSVTAANNIIFNDAECGKEIAFDVVNADEKTTSE